MRSLLMAAMSALCIATLFPGTSIAARPRPTRVSARTVVCVENTTIVSQKGVCYVYDIRNGEHALEVRMAAGLNVSAGTVIFGGSFKSLLEIVVEFPLGTDVDEAVAEAAATLRDELKKKETKKKIEALGTPFDSISKPRKVLYCEPEDPLTVKLKKALGQETEAE